MKNINDALGRLAALLGGGGLSELDRDVALSLLKDIYQEVKFGDSATASVAAGEEDGTMSTCEPSEASSPTGARSSAEGWRGSAEGGNSARREAHSPQPVPRQNVR